MKPNLINGIGYCAGDGCPEYDGKRCQLMGFRPQGICEPWVLELVAKVKNLEKELENLELQHNIFTLQDV